MTDVNLDNVRIFMHVADSGSVTAAARRLGVPKSTVSRRLSELETAVGARLVHRTTRSLALTSAGKRYYEQIAGPVKELETALRSLHSLDASPRGTLRITTPTDLAISAMLPMMESFLSTYPEVQLVIVPTSRRVDLIAEGIDLALRGGPLPESTLVARRLLKGHFELLASSEYLARRGTPQTPEDIEQHDCLIFSADAPVQTWHLISVEREVTVTARGRLAMNDFGSLTRACVGGAGIALLPRTWPLAVGAPEGLVRVLPGWHGATAELHAVFPSRQQLSPTVRAFIDHATEYFRDVQGALPPHAAV